MTVLEWIACIVIFTGFCICSILTYLVNKQKQNIKKIQKLKDKWETK